MKMIIFRILLIKRRFFFTPFIRVICSMFIFFQLAIELEQNEYFINTHDPLAVAAFKYITASVCFFFSSFSSFAFAALRSTKYIQLHFISFTM